MKVLGLTGGIATGKSTICRTIREQGIPVVDCDEIAHQVVQKGNWGHRRVVKAFGGGVLQADGELDRPALGNLIFNHPEARKKLNKATHLPVFVEMFRQLFLQWLSGQAIVAQLVIAPAALLLRASQFVDMPLLFETGANKWFAQTVLVACSQTAQLDRLMQRDNCPREAAQAKISAQMPLSIKQEKSTFVIPNDSSQEQAVQKTIKLIGELQGQVGWSALLTSPFVVVAAVVAIVYFLSRLLQN